MNIIARQLRCRTWSMTVVLMALAAGCSGDRTPILGSGGAALAPIVTAVTPMAGAVGVPTNKTVINATFNEAVAAFTGGASFTVTCSTPAPCAAVTGTVTLDPTSTIATFTLTPGTALAPLTLYTATVTGATNPSSGLALASPYVWQFTTGVTPAAPTVTAVVPTDNAVGVPLNDSVGVEFSEPMDPLTGAEGFTVTCVAPCVSPVGTAAVSADGMSATFTPSANLAAGKLYTVTVTGTTSTATGLALAAPFVSRFTTGAAADTTRPRVVATVPATTTPGPTLAVPVNSAITATFTESMAPAMINATSFTVTCAAPCVSPAGAVTYEGAQRTAVFTPTAPLAVGATYTATITTAATDLAGNGLAGNQAPLPAASNYVWTFTTAAATPAGNLSVKSSNPSAGQLGVCPNAAVNATFTVPAGQRIDPSTINASTFKVTGPGPALTTVTPSSVTLDTATGTIATFTPLTPLIPGGTYTATIIGGANGVKDLAVPADTLTNNDSWNFTAGASTGNCLAPVALGAASPFGNFGGTAGMTNTGTLTVVNGDTGSIATGTSSITGFNDTAGDVYTETPANHGNVNGTIYSCTHSTTGPTSTGPNAANCSIATQARLDAQTAYLALAAMPAGANPGGNLAGLTLAPGVYTAPAGSFMIQGGDLTLDAGGNANAVWVFQMATTLSVGGPGAAAPESIILAGGAQAKNIFWQVGAAATINAGGGGTFEGTVISQAGAAVSTAGNVNVVTINGRVLSLGASVTVVDTVINVPAP